MSEGTHHIPNAPLGVIQALKRLQSVSSRDAHMAQVIPLIRVLSALDPVPTLGLKGHFGAVFGHEREGVGRRHGVSDDAQLGVVPHLFVIVLLDREQQLVILATAEHAQRWVEVEFACRLVHLGVNRQLVFVDLEAHARRGAEVHDFAGKPVADVDHGGRLQAQIPHLTHHIHACLGLQLAPQQVGEVREFRRAVGAAWNTVFSRSRIWSPM